MIKLAVLLVGIEAMRRKWRVLTAIGLVWISIAVVILADVTDGRFTLFATHFFGYFFIVEGTIAFVMMIGAGGSNVLYIGRAIGLIVLGGMIADFPVRVDIANSILFGIAFAVDGSVRIATAWTIRYPRWQVIVVGGLVELVLAVFCFTSWPVPYRRTVPFCISVALIITGFNALRLGLLLRRLPSRGSLTALPMFGARGWHRSLAAPPVEDASALPHEARDAPLVVHVWTPLGSATDPARRPLVDRYIAAVDGKGVISTGHAALEHGPDVYVSHYPAVEIDHSPDDFGKLLKATAENDVPGRFQPSYREEAAGWCEADANVVFHRHDPVKLRAFWAAYRADDTYNLTNRNCSVAVAAALEAALEGTAATSRIWLRFLTLVTNPDLWLAHALREKAEAMTWTPGMVLDYALALRRVLEPAGDHGWVRRARGTLKAWRAARAFERQRRLAATATARDPAGRPR